jgi:hypothetical protein
MCRTPSLTLKDDGTGRPVGLRGGKDNRHFGHRSHGTFVLTPLTPPKQCTVLFGKCGVRPSAALHSAQDDMCDTARDDTGNKNDKSRTRHPRTQ